MSSSSAINKPAQKYNKLKAKCLFKTSVEVCTAVKALPQKSSLTDKFARKGDQPAASWVWGLPQGFSCLFKSLLLLLLHSDTQAIT